jgi:polyketide cyclase/dehydrase/lipid transport protein
MPLDAIRSNSRAFTPARARSTSAKASAALASVYVAAFLSACVAPASADSLSRSIDVNGTPGAVWSMIGPFCAIKDWLPPVGTCTLDGATPPTRTLVTKDGKTTFVELQTARDDAKHLYSYTFVSSPLPVTHYTSTITVTAKSESVSTVTWSGAYTPDPGKEKDANDTLSGIYKSGLDMIKAKLAN